MSIGPKELVERLRYRARYGAAWWLEGQAANLIERQAEEIVSWKAAAAAEAERANELAADIDAMTGWPEKEARLAPAVFDTAPLGSLLWIFPEEDDGSITGVSIKLGPDHVLWIGALKPRYAQTDPSVSEAVEDDAWWIIVDDRGELSVLGKCSERAQSIAAANHLSALILEQIFPDAGGAR